MLADRVEQAAQVDHAIAVEMQSLDGGAAGWCQANYQSKVVAPGKVRVPPIAARVVQRHLLAIDGIRRGDFVVFVVIAMDWLI
jgi:hypothetical protein